MQKIFLKEVDSTMDEARAEAEYLKPNAHLMVVADKQLKGRGQKGKRWESKRGGIYFTIASSVRDEVDLSGYSLFIGILLNKTFSNFNIKTKLKWPNDIFDLNGKKVSGVLIETYKKENQQILLTGIGINLLNIPDVDIAVNSISNLSNKEIKRLEVLSTFEKYFEKEINIFIDRSFNEYYEDWNEINYFKDKEVTFDNGKIRNTGISKGVNNKGMFLVEVRGEILSFISGNITL